MIQLIDVDFAYDEKPVLSGVNLDIQPSEVVVIMGPSGSGKSTILRLILGLETPQNGKVIVHGQNMCTASDKEKRHLRKEIGMVFQDGALFDSLTVGENVGYYLFEHTSMKPSEIEARVVEMLGFVGLDSDEVIDKLPEELSGGMQRRVAIGRALLSTDPTIMLYDEPTTGLDPQATAKVLGLMNKLVTERSIATIMVTHQIADAISIANRFIVVHEGEIAFDGSGNEMRESTDQRVVDFLAPFRESCRTVVHRKLIEEN